MHVKMRKMTRLLDTGITDADNALIRCLPKNEVRCVCVVGGRRWGYRPIFVGFTPPLVDGR